MRSVSYTHLDVYKRQELQASYDAQTDVAKKAELETELSAAKAEYTSRHQSYTCLLYTSALTYISQSNLETGTDRTAKCCSERNKL